MNKIIFFIINMFFLSTLYSQKEYYKNEITRKVITKSEYEKYLVKLYEDNLLRYKDFSIEEIIKNKIIKKDSIIKICSLVSNVVDHRKPKKEKEDIQQFKNKKLPSTVLILNNKKIDFSKIDKPTIINFWNTTSKFSKGQIRILNKLKDKYQSNVEFIAITALSSKKVTAFLLKQEINFDQIINQKEYIEKIGINVFPKTLFIDKNGVVKEIIGSPPHVIVNGEMRVFKGKDFEKVIKKIVD